MVERQADLDFALEALAKDGISYEVIEWNLEGDQTSGVQVGRFEDRRHAALVDQLEDREAPVDEVSGPRLRRQGTYFDAGDGRFTAYAQSAHRRKKAVDDPMSIQSMISTLIAPP